MIIRINPLSLLIVCSSIIFINNKYNISDLNFLLTSNYLEIYLTFFYSLFFICMIRRIIISLKNDLDNDI